MRRTESVSSFLGRLLPVRFISTGNNPRHAKVAVTNLTYCSGGLNSKRYFSHEGFRN